MRPPRPTPKLPRQELASPARRTTPEQGGTTREQGAHRPADPTWPDAVNARRAGSTAPGPGHGLPDLHEEGLIEDLFADLQLGDEEVTMRTDLSDLIEVTRSSELPPPPVASSAGAPVEGERPTRIARDDDTEKGSPPGPHTAQGWGLPPLPPSPPSPMNFAQRSRPPRREGARVPPLSPGINSVPPIQAASTTLSERRGAPGAAFGLGDAHARPTRAVEIQPSALQDTRQGAPSWQDEASHSVPSEAVQWSPREDAVIGPVALAERPRRQRRRSYTFPPVADTEAAEGGLGNVSRSNEEAEAAFLRLSVEEAATGGRTAFPASVAAGKPGGGPDGSSDEPAENETAELDEAAAHRHERHEEGPEAAPRLVGAQGALGAVGGRRRGLAVEGVRRVNNMPLLIALLMAVGFGGVIAYAASSRKQVAHEQEVLAAPRQQLSATAFAEEITRKHRNSGMVLDGQPEAMALAGSGELSRDQGQGAQALPPLAVADVTRAEMEAEAQAPTLPAAPDPDAVDMQDLGQDPPQLGQAPPQDPPQDLGQAHMMAGQGQANPLAQLKLDMFRQALTAKTAVAFSTPQPQQRGAVAQGGTQPQAMRAYAAVPPPVNPTTAPNGGYAEAPPAGGPRDSYGMPGNQDGDVYGGGMGEGYDQGYMDKMREMGGAEYAQTAEARYDEQRRRDQYADYEGEPGQDRWQLGALQVAPRTPYELRAGAVIPGVMITGINSDVGGQVMAQVAQHVYDTATGDFLLIPQGSRLVGTYGSEVAYGQERVLVAWQRIVFPDGKALDIGAMPGADSAGYSGFHDQVNNHYLRIFAGAILLSAITAGVSMSNQGMWDYQPGGMTLGGALSRSLGQQLGSVSAELVRRNMNIAPTLEIRPGYRFNVVATKDLTFPRPYEAFDYEHQGQRQ